MAPSTKGTNPAPNYTVAMNQVQTQIEAQLRIVRSFMPSRAPPSTQTGTTKPTPSFSALAASTPKTSLLPRRRTPKQEAESLFTETHAQDPNAGLGFGISSKRAAERENQILRSRLLGRKRGASDAPSRMRHRDESSDEEPGRSGLGRAKKRARREESRKEEEEEEEGQRIEEATKPRTKLEKPGVTQVGEGSAVNDGEETGDVDMKTAPDSASNPVPNGAESAPDEGMKKRKRKKKKKKKGKEKSEEATVE